MTDPSPPPTVRYRIAVRDPEWRWMHNAVTTSSSLGWTPIAEFSSFGQATHWAQHMIPEGMVRRVIPSDASGNFTLPQEPETPTIYGLGNKPHHTLCSRYSSGPCKLCDRLYREFPTIKDQLMPDIPNDPPSPPPAIDLAELAAREICNDELRPMDEIAEIIRSHYAAELTAARERIAGLERENEAIKNPCRTDDKSQSQQAEAWSAVWRELEHAGIYQFVASDSRGRTRAVEYIRKLAQLRSSNDRLRRFAENCANDFHDRVSGGVKMAARAALASEPSGEEGGG